MIEQDADYLERRGGGHFRCPVRLPVIPLGVDCDFYAPREDNADPGAGPAARRGLRAPRARHRRGRSRGAVRRTAVVSCHRARHPECTWRRRGPFFQPREWEKEIHGAALRCSGAARAHFIDGSDGPYGPVMRAAWRASDILVSLYDNIQDTNGLTPVEAMAAHLSCVGSDWNGYQDTVVDGETGFRIPAVTAKSPRLATDRELRARPGAAAMSRARHLARLAGGDNGVPGSLARTGGTVYGPTAAWPFATSAKRAESSSPTRSRSIGSTPPPCSPRAPWWSRRAASWRGTWQDVAQLRKCTLRAPHDRAWLPARRGDHSRRYAAFHDRPLGRSR